MTTFEVCQIFSYYYFSYVWDYKATLVGGNYMATFEEIMATFKKILTLHPVEVSSSPIVHDLLQYFEVKQIEAVADVLQNRCSKKFHNIHRKTPASEFLFDKVAGLKAYKFNKKRLLHRCLSVNIAKILRIALFIEHL